MFPPIVVGYQSSQKICIFCPRKLKIYQGATCCPFTTFRFLVLNIHLAALLNDPISTIIKITLFYSATLSKLWVTLSQQVRISNKTYFLLMSLKGTQKMKFMKLYDTTLSPFMPLFFYLKHIGTQQLTQTIPRVSFLPNSKDFLFS